MAIRNVLLGGATDWADGEPLKQVDLNDTMNAAAEKVQELTAFWLNSYLNDTYDDFESYSTGNMATNTNWTVTLATTGNTPTCTVQSSTNAGGSGKELKLYAPGKTTGSIPQSASAAIQSKLIPTGRHVFFRIAFNTNSTSDGSFIVKAGGSGGTTIFTYSGGSTSIFPAANVVLIAKSNSTYDVYVNNSYVANVASNIIYVISSIYDHDGRSTNVYVDDFKISKHSVF